MIKYIKKTKKACPVKLVCVERSRGYVLLETIFYVIIFAVLSIAVINSMITMVKAFKETTIQSELMQGGNVMERLSREIRQAYSINSISTNDLKLNSTDNGGANKTIEFALTGSNIALTENNTLTGNLNTPNIAVTGLTFTQINTAKGVAIKISLTVKSNHDSQNRNESFYDTVVLRGAY